jgi:tight adherence protein B
MMVTIALLYALAFAGLTIVFLRAMREGVGLYEGTYSANTARQLEDVFLFVPPRRVAEIGWVAAIAVFLLVFLTTARFTSVRGVLLGAVVAALFGALALAAPSALVRVLKRRRLARFNQQLGDTLVNMSNALKAGFSITQAFESVVRDGDNPIAQEFEVFLQQTRVGVAFSTALDNMAARVPSIDLQLVVVAIDTARRTGGNLTEIFEQIATTIRERVRIERRIQTLTAQGRLQGIIVSIMPVVVGLLLLLVDPEMMMPFLQSTAGVCTIVIVGTLLTMGALVIRRIVRIDV